MPSCIQLGVGKGEITTAVVVAACGVICVAGVFVTLWAALRRPLEPRIVSAMRELDVRLDEIDGQIAAVAWPVVEPAARIGKAIGSSAELDEVMLRTLAAAGAVRATEGSSISVRPPDGPSPPPSATSIPRGPS